MAISTPLLFSSRGRLLALAAACVMLSACTSIELPPYNPGGPAATRPATVPSTPAPAPTTGVVVEPIPLPTPQPSSVLQPSMGLDSGETIIGESASPIGAATPAPTAPATPDRLCNEGAGQFAVGQPYSLSLLNQVRERTGSRGVRVLRPRDVATMDFNIQRANLLLDADGKVETMRCG